MLTTCDLCGFVGNCDTHHCFQGMRRQASDKYGAILHLCRSCHEDIHKHPKTYEWLKAEVQERVMKEQGWTLDDWLEHFYKNYLR